MIQAEFFESKGLKIGFKISGHAGYSDSGSDIVCAAVSSAVQLTVNTLDSFGCRPDAFASGDTVKCTVSESGSHAGIIISSLMMHLKAISEDYPNTINITISEV